MCIRDRSIADRPGLAVGFAGGVLAMNGTNFAALAHGETTGISGGFLAALLAGFAAGYIVQFLKKITEKLPATPTGDEAPLTLWAIVLAACAGLALLLLVLRRRNSHRTA